MRAKLIKVFCDEVVAQNMRPMLIVADDGTHENVKGLGEGGEITFDLSPKAIRDFYITDTCLSFRASFGGKVRSIKLNILAVGCLHVAESTYPRLEFDYETRTDCEIVDLLNFKSKIKN